MKLYSLITLMLWALLGQSVMAASPRDMQLVLDKQGIRPQRTLEDDCEITEAPLKQQR